MGRPKSPFNVRAYPPGNMVKTKKANQLITEYNFKQNKDLKLITEILMRGNSEIFIKKL